MVEVKFYETNSKLKKGEALGVFSIPFVPKEVAPVDETLEGEELEADKERYARELDEADMEVKAQALEKVHSIVGWKCVLVARIIKEEEQ